jgi:predicted metal-dependent hydrolase
MKTQRNPQLNLKLDTNTPDPAQRWHEGSAIAFLGGTLTLALGSEHREALRAGGTLYLPLPPLATPRQIQDRAEAWLREEAKRYLTPLIAQKSTLGTRQAPRLVLSFAARGHWVEVQDAETLRCNWRLIEQTPAVIEAAITRAMATLPPKERSFDLFDIALA